MKLLLDTHVFIWATTATSLLSAKVLDLLGDTDNEVMVSAVSAYEIEFKRPRDGELQRMPSDLNEAARFQNFSWLPMSWRHARDAGLLPMHHRDPWDRILVAQALAEGAALVSIDRQLGVYAAQVVW